MLNDWNKKHVMMVQRQKASPKLLEKIGLRSSCRERKGQDNLGQRVVREGV